MTEAPENSAVYLDGTPLAPADQVDGISSQVDNVPVNLDGSLSVSEAAAQLRVSERTIRRRIKDGSLPASKLPTTQGYEWRVYLDGAPVQVDKLSSRHAVQVDSSTAAPNLMKALEIIEAIRREHEEARREFDARAEQLRQEKDAQLDRLHQEASEKAEKIAELTGAAAHWQTRAIVAEEQARKAEEQVKLLMAPKDEPEPEPAAEPERVSWWKRFFS